MGTFASVKPYTLRFFSTYRPGAILRTWGRIRAERRSSGNHANVLPCSRRSIARLAVRPPWRPVSLLRRRCQRGSEGRAEEPLQDDIANDRCLCRLRSRRRHRWPGIFSSGRCCSWLHHAVRSDRASQCESSYWSHARSGICVRRQSSAAKRFGRQRSRSASVVKLDGSGEALP